MALTQGDVSLLHQILEFVFPGDSDDRNTEISRSENANGEFGFSVGVDADGIRDCLAFRICFDLDSILFLDTGEMVLILEILINGSWTG